MEQFTSVKHITDPFIRIYVSMQNRIDCLFLPPTKLVANLDIKWLSAKIAFVMPSTAPTTSGGTCRVNTRAKKVGCFLHNISLADFWKRSYGNLKPFEWKRPKGGFFTPDNWTRKSYQQREERSKKEKNNGALLAFMMATLEIVWAEKNCLGEEVYLALKNVFKNPATALLYQIIVSQSRPKYPWRKKVKLLRCQPYLCTNLTNFIRFWIECKLYKKWN